MLKRQDTQFKFWETLKGTSDSEKEFINNSYKRALTEEHSVPDEAAFFTNNLSYSYPEDFPEYYKSLVDENKIEIPSLDQDRLRKIKNKLKIKDNI